MYFHSFSDLSLVVLVGFDGPDSGFGGRGGGFRGLVELVASH